jgi:hypothetical protein
MLFARYHINDDQARRIHALIADQLSARKNWLVTAVENDQHDKAADHCREIRKLQDLYAAFNIDVKRDIGHMPDVIDVR